MIDTIFEFGNEVIQVRVIDTNVLFRTQQFGSMLVPIDSLQLDKTGSIKEHPDLEGRDDWREETIKRFKKHIKKMRNEIQRMNYVIDELTKFGYKPLYRKRAGYRTQKL